MLLINEAAERYQQQQKTGNSTFPSTTGPHQQEGLQQPLHQAKKLPEEVYSIPLPTRLSVGTKHWNIITKSGTAPGTIHHAAPSPVSSSRTVPSSFLAPSVSSPSPFPGSCLLPELLPYVAPPLS